MTEARQVHEPARRALAPFGRFLRVDNPLTPGGADTYYILRQVPGWIEEKVVPPSGRCPDHFTREQLLWGEAEVRAGGRWYLLARCGPEWWLMDVGAARRWFEGGEAEPMLRAAGAFPTKQVLDVIAPLGAGRASTEIWTKSGTLT